MTEQEANAARKDLFNALNHLRRAMHKLGMETPAGVIMGHHRDEAIVHNLSEKMGPLTADLKSTGWQYKAYGVRLIPFEQGRGLFHD